MPEWVWYMANIPRLRDVLKQYLDTAHDILALYHKPLRCLIAIINLLPMYVIRAVKINVLSYTWYMVWYTTSVSQSAFRAWTAQFIIVFIWCVYTITVYFSLHSLMCFLLFATSVSFKFLMVHKYSELYFSLSISVNITPNVNLIASQFSNGALMMTTSENKCWETWLLFPLVIPSMLMLCCVILCFSLEARMSTISCFCCCHDPSPLTFSTNG